MVESRGHRGTFVRDVSADEVVAAARLPELADAAQAYAVLAQQHGVEWEEAVTVLERQWNLLG